MVTILAKVLQKAASVLALGNCARISSCCDDYNYMQMGNQRTLWWGAGQGSLTEILSLGAEEG